MKAIASTVVDEGTAATPAHMANQRNAQPRRKSIRPNVTLPAGGLRLHADSPEFALHER